LYEEVPVFGFGDKPTKLYHVRCAERRPRLKPRATPAGFHVEGSGLFSSNTIGPGISGNLVPELALWFAATKLRHPCHSIAIQAR